MAYCVVVDASGRELTQEVMIDPWTTTHFYMTGRNDIEDAIQCHRLLIRNWRGDIMNTHDYDPPIDVARDPPGNDWGIEQDVFCGPSGLLFPTLLLREWAVYLVERGNGA